jgi:hypothetical protein
MRGVSFHARKLPNVRGGRYRKSCSALVFLLLLLLLNLIIASGRQKKRARAKLAPILDPLDAGGRPDPADVRRFAADPETRNGLYDAMAQRGRQALFPAEYRTRDAFAESNMAFWLSHPHELGKVPDELQLAQVVTVATEVGPVEYYLFRFARTRRQGVDGRGFRPVPEGPPGPAR